MNKQELINELKRISLEKQHKALTHPESKNYYEGMVMAYSQVAHMVNTVLKLDEPQKPVVPKFVAELLDYYRQSTDVDLLALLITFHDWYYRKTKDGEHEEAIDWLVDHPEIYMRAWLFGYEVEKEPLYYVVFDILQEQKFLVKNIKTKLFYLSNNENVIGNYEQVSFTEQEIKEIDERYWPFAVPVVEEAEA
ncbi:DUF1642 domain-containing protein [Enterococcus faecium]